jgi:hypothetical protein
MYLLYYKNAGGKCYMEAPLTVNGRNQQKKERKKEI